MATSRPMNIHNRWFQLCASLIAMIMIANLQYAWTLFVKPLHAGTGWTLSEIQLAATFFILFQTWAQPCQGWLIDRMGPRLFVSLAGVLCGIGWGGLGYATSLPMLYTLYVLAGIGAALVYGGSIGSALKWFTTDGGWRRHHGGRLRRRRGAFHPDHRVMLRTVAIARRFLDRGLPRPVILIVAQFLRHPRRAGRARRGTDGGAARLGSIISRRARCCAPRSSI